MASPLGIYLRNHEAAGQAGRDLFRRAAANQRSRPHATQLAELSTQIDEDLRRLRGMMARADVKPDVVLGVALRAGERFGRLKPNGRLVFRAPLSDLIEVEALLDAVRAKWAGWHALGSAGAAALRRFNIDPAEVDDLRQRAEQQIDALVGVHGEVSAQVLGPNAA